MVASGLPLWFAKEAVIDAQEKDSKTGARVGPNDRIVMGAIGTGTNRNSPRKRQRARFTANAASISCRPPCGRERRADGRRLRRGPSQCRISAQGLVRTAARAAAAGNASSSEATFASCWRNRDINAVTIGTPDHWHALIAIAAMRAGKDVYCEKPMTLTIEESKMVARVARETRKIFQVGTQQRTEMNGRFRLAAELVRNGRIGRVQRITTLIGSNPVGGPFQVRPVPEGLDWNFWLGPTVRRSNTSPSDASMNSAWWYEYSGGKMTDWEGRIEAMTSRNGR